MTNTMSCRISVAIILVVASLSASAMTAHAQDSVRPGEKGDYLVTQGKQPVWASQVTKKPTQSQPSPSSTGYFVTEGKRRQWREGTPSSTEVATPPTTPSSPSKGRYVQDGKRLQWVAEPNTPK